MSVIFEIDERTNSLSKEILDICFFIHTELGPGLLESVYEDSLFFLLNQKGTKAERQKHFPVKIKDYIVPTSLKADLVVEERIIVELKTVEKIIPLHEVQLHTYLKISGLPLGLLINFNTKSLKDGIKRIAMSQNTKKENFV
jgi:GxxExxY protein